MRALLILLMSAALALAADCALAAPGGRRVALVIGNGQYTRFSALPNPRNDAQDVADELRKQGFEVISGFDLGREAIRDRLRQFARAAQGAEAALAYYAGHGLQYRNRNYIVPVDAQLQDEFDLEYETVRIDDVVEELKRADGARILILDACRNLPVKTSTGRNAFFDTGLAKYSGRGLVVAYATQANALAYDGSGRNSIFTKAFLKTLREPGLELPAFFQRVSMAVDTESEGQQTPELSLSFPGKFIFNQSETDRDAWRKLRDSSDPVALREFLKKFPNSDLADAATGRLALIEETRLASRREAELQAARQADSERQRREEEARRLQAAEEERRRIQSALLAEDEQRRRLAEEARKAQEARQQQLADAQRKAESLRLAEDARKAEEARIQQLADARRKAEALRLAEDARKAEEVRIQQLADAQRKAETLRLAEEARKAEDARQKQLAEDRRRAEAFRLAEEARKAEEARQQLAEDRRTAEAFRMAEETRRLEERRRQVMAEQSAVRTELSSLPQAGTSKEPVALGMAAAQQPASDPKQDGMVVALLSDAPGSAVRPAPGGTPVDIPRPTYATLPGAQKNAEPAAQVQPEGDELVRRIHERLNIAGCYTKRPETSWNQDSVDAIKRFYQFARLDDNAKMGAGRALKLASTKPDLALLEDLSKFDRQICPIVCPEGSEARDGVCVKVTCPTGFDLKHGACTPRPVAERPSRPDRKLREPAAAPQQAARPTEKPHAKPPASRPVKEAHTAPPPVREKKAAPKPTVRVVEPVRIRPRVPALVRAHPVQPARPTASAAPSFGDIGAVRAMTRMP